MSDDPDQEHFADGISEDLITGLSRIHWLFVIARNSTFVYKNRAVDMKQVARELGVRYVLEGSVRRAGKRLRISAQLIDATTGGHHWAERYDRELGDIFAVQDEITSSVAAAIEPRLLAAEGVRALARSADDLGAWELVARAQTQFWRMTRADYETADRPARARCRGLSGLCASAQPAWDFVWCLQRTWGGSSATRDCSPATNMPFGPIALDDRDPWGHVALGYWAMMQRRTAESIAAFRRALESQSEFRHSPRSPRPHLRFRRSVPRGDRAWGKRDQAQPVGSGDGVLPRRSSRSPTIRPADMRNRPDWAEEALRLRPGFQGAQRMRCASLAQAGRIDEARTISRDGATRAAGDIDRMDQGQRSLSDARTVGALPGGYAEGGLE